MAIWSKVKHLAACYYAVPWCVPAWGWAELLATARCVLTGHTVRGHYPETFAAAIRDFLGVSFALPVNRGRTAIEVALRAMGCQADDEVVLPAYLCRSVLDAVIRAGCQPVFADVGEDLHVTSRTIKSALTPRTRCVIVPHLFGNTAPIDKIEETLEGTGINLIDDAAQSFGALCKGRRVGTFGRCGIVSVGPAKALAGVAGGLLVTNDRQLFERASALVCGWEKVGSVLRRTLSFWVWRRLRRYTLPTEMVLSRIRKPTEDTLDAACRMSNLDGAIGLCQLRSLWRNAENRRRNAKALLPSVGRLADANIVALTPDGMVLKLALVLREKDPAAGELLTRLAAAGIECQRGFVPLHKSATRESLLPVTEAVWDRVVCIPVDRPLRRHERLRRILNGRNGHSRNESVNGG